MQNLRRRQPESGLDRAMLFLLATAKLNQAERFGVGLGETYGFNSGDDTPPERVYMELEEHYTLGSSRTCWTCSTCRSKSSRRRW